MAEGLRNHHHIMVEDVEGTRYYYDKEHHCNVKKVKCVCMFPGCDYKRFGYYFYYYPPSDKNKDKVLQKNKRRYNNHRK